MLFYRPIEGSHGPGPHSAHAANQGRPNQERPAIAAEPYWDRERAIGLHWGEVGPDAADGAEERREPPLTVSEWLRQQEAEEAEPNPDDALDRLLAMEGKPTPAGGLEFDPDDPTMDGLLSWQEAQDLRMGRFIPTPETIAQRAAEIRERWGKRDLEQRGAWMVSRPVTADEWVELGMAEDT